MQTSKIWVRRPSAKNCETLIYSSLYSQALKLLAKSAYEVLTAARAIGQLTYT